ncbi:MAG TPA: recombinase RecT [Sphingomicrobium sp.]|nr:recombinase RecT [Sphingomicrobium sp.]
MNAIATVEPPKSKVTQFLDQVFAADRATGMYLPAHIDVGMFRANLYTAVTLKPELLQCHPTALYQEVCAAASLGLRFDPALGEAYLIVVQGKPQLRIGYRGHIKLALQSGEVKQVYAHEVHALDTFDVALGEEKRLIHKPNLDEEDPGPIRFYYSVAKFRGGETDFDVMSVKQIHAIRARSDGWRAYSAGKIKSTPWLTDEQEMSKKTVIRRLLKRLPKSPEVNALLNRDQELEDVEHQDVSAPRPVPTLRVMKAPAPPEAPVADLGDIPACLDRRSKHEPVESPPPGSQVGDVVEVPEAGELADDAACGDAVDLVELILIDFEKAVSSATSLAEIAECEEGLRHELAGLTITAEAEARIAKVKQAAFKRLEPPAEPQPKRKAAPPPPTDAAATEPAGEPIDRSHWAYKRGWDDFTRGVRKPLAANIKDDPAALAQWQYGQDDARDVNEANS